MQYSNVSLVGWKSWFGVLGPYLTLSLVSVSAAGFGIAWVMNKQKIEKRDNLKQPEGTKNPCKTKLINKNANNHISGAKEDKKLNDHKKTVVPNKLKVLYGTERGTTKHFADFFVTETTDREVDYELISMKDYDPDEQLCEEAGLGSLMVFFISTYTDGTPPEDAEWFYNWVRDAAADFRVSKALLEGLQFCVIAFGNSAYEDHFCTPGKNLHKYLVYLGASPILPVAFVDENTVKSKNGGNEGDFQFWNETFWKRVTPVDEDGLKLILDKSASCCGEHKDHDAQTEQACSGGGCGSGSCSSSKNKEEHEGGGDFETDSENEDDDESSSVLDVEDLGSMMSKLKQAKVKRQEESTLSEPAEMLTPLLRKELTKQGYRLIGSHSGVKLCRWTKAMLRGRGGCYKHTFYGIESHRCMETTPSLACANKCVFCWRHHTNPVGTEWRWKQDTPDLILDGALEYHSKLVKEFKGVPGVKADRLAEGMTPRHCALSLVGEPIMYPEINAFLDLLHRKQISSFLVTNAQFPDAIRELKPVTQLYVSVDASTKESLKAIDRPLFKDFWQRFLDSLKALSDKGQRTVYRLTLVKAWNTDELQSYAKLVSLGNPDFIEIKGVTYCGDSKSSKLTMKNVPWHEEVIGFVQMLADLLPNYSLACEHEHSNCLLLAHNKFQVNGEWWTWIDYEKFNVLIDRYDSSDGQETFNASDYMARTPDWAVFGSKERGFDPDETRFHRRTKNKDISGC